MSPQSASATQPAKIKEMVSVREPSADLLQEFGRTFDSISRRAFEIFEGNGYFAGNDLADWLRAESELLHPVHLEIKESANAFSVRAEVPGFSAANLEISLEPRCLRIKGSRESKQESKTNTTLLSECCAGRILRAVELPADVDPEKASATLADGILTLNLPKASSAKAIRIQPKVS